MSWAFKEKQRHMWAASTPALGSTSALSFPHGLALMQEVAQCARALVRILAQQYSCRAAGTLMVDTHSGPPEAGDKGEALSS